MNTYGFVEDMYPPQLLYARTIRAPVASGRFVSVECPRLPDAYTLITAADIPGLNRLDYTGQPILAGDVLSYIGEPVALLLGADPVVLDEYAGQCAVITRKDDHDFSPNAFSTGAFSSAEILAERNIRNGNPEEVFSQQNPTIHCTYHCGIQEHWYAEPVGALAIFDTESNTKNNKNLIVYTATQWPAHVKTSIARMLTLEPARVEVRPTLSGIHMDGKLVFPSLVACHAALGAWITGKAVRLMLSKEEDFRYSPKRAEALISINTALNERGGINGNEIDVLVNMGAYGIAAREILDQAFLGSLGIYRNDNTKLSARAVKTNIPPQGPFAGYGLAQGLFAIERHVSFLADLEKKNPAQWRKEHCIQLNLLPPGLVIKEVPPVATLIDTAAALSDYNRKWAAYELIRQTRKQSGMIIERGESLRGIGIALGWQGSGFIHQYAEKAVCGMELTMDKDGSLEIKSNAAANDGGTARVWAQVAAEILSIDVDKVKISNDAGAPDAGPASASRNITVMTKLLERCCMDIRKQRFRDPLPITVRRTVRSRHPPLWEKRLSPSEAEGIDAAGFLNPAWAAAVVEVEIDPVEYNPIIRGIWLSVDGGKILLEDRARHSLKIASIQALGWASREELHYNNGSISREQFIKYNILKPAAIPPIHIGFLPDDSGRAKGIGDLPFNCIPAAFLQAASQAIDNHFQSIPLRSRDIWEAVKRKEEGSAL